MNQLVIDLIFDNPFSLWNVIKFQQIPNTVEPRYTEVGYNTILL